MKSNRFERHSRKYIIGIIILSIVLSAYGLEMFFSSNFGGKVTGELTRVIRNANKIRHIRLAELAPSSLLYVTPTDNQIKGFDSLVKKEFRFEIDINGFIYPSVVHENPDLSIVFLGGSTTECLYVEEKNRFPYLVGTLLEHGNRKVNSINSGISGNNTMHSINILLNKVLKFNPDIVVLMHNVNDLNILLYENDYWNNNMWRSLLIIDTCSGVQEDPSYLNKIKHQLKNSFPALYKKIVVAKRKYIDGQSDNEVDQFANVRGKKLVIDAPKILKMFEANLKIFVSIARAKEIMPVLMTQSSRFRKDPDKIILQNWTMEKEFGITYEQYRDIYDNMNESVRKVAKENSVLLIDLAKEIPQTKDYLFDYVHFNDNGSILAAKVIANQLDKVIINSSGD